MSQGQTTSNDTESNGTKPQRPKQRWLQYSLRGLLALTLLAAAGSWWLSSELLLAQREEKALEQFRSSATYSFNVAYRHQIGEGYSIDLDAVGPGNPWLRSMLGDAYFDEPATIIFASESLSDAVAHGFRDLPTLQEVQLATQQPSSKQAAADLGTLNELKRLSIDQNEPWGGDKLAALSPLPKLETVTVLQCGRLTAEQARQFVRGKQALNWVALLGCSFEPGALAVFADLPAIQTLHIGDSYDPDELAEFRRSGLQALSVGDSLIDDDALAAIGLINSLQRLELRRASFTDAGIANISGLTNLNTLIVDECPIDGTGLAQLRGLSSLEWVSLQEMPITDDGMAALAQISSLKKVLLSDLQISGAGLAELRHAPQLEELWLSTNKSLRNSDLATLQDFPSLRNLTLIGSNFTDSCLPILVAIPLDELRLPSSITPAALPYLLQMTSLKKLNLPSSLSYQATTAVQAGLPNCKVSGGTQRPPGSRPKPAK